MIAYSLVDVKSSPEQSQCLFIMNLILVYRYQWNLYQIRKVFNDIHLKMSSAKYPLFYSILKVLIEHWWLFIVMPNKIHI